MSESTIHVATGADREDPQSPDLVFGAPDAAEVGTGESALEQLRATLAAPVDSEPLTLKVPGRPGVKITCHTRMTQEERKAWQERSRDRKKQRRLGSEREAPIDEMRFACLVVANTCETILMDGEIATDAADQPLNFRHKQLWDMVGAAEPETAIRKFFGGPKMEKDAHVLLASGEILIASGYDDDLSDDEGPTGG